MTQVHDRLLNPAFDREPMSRPITGCRACGSQHLHVFLDLGEAPLADRLLACDHERRAEPRFELMAALCRDCALVQITETVRPEVLFADEYPYFSSVSPTVLSHARRNVGDRLKERRLDRSSLVVELASNDGYLLKNYVEAGVSVLGIDPAGGPVKAARAAHVDTLQAFFSHDLARDVARRRGHADIIHANHVLAHAADTNGFVAGIAHLLKDDGTAVIEVAYLRSLIEGLQFDTICHAHLCYFSLTALDSLFRRHGLFINRVERHDIHGGTLRVFAEKQEACEQGVLDLLAEERAIGIASGEYFDGFAQEVELLRDKLVDMIEGLRASGRSIAAYAASAKGATLLDYCGIDRRHISFVADRNSHKQGRMMPGAHIPILPAEALFEERPDYTLLLAWNFADEIIAQQAAYLEAGGKFIIPLPEPIIIEG
ncbi:class I SAM-dependent methyltransferase [Croceicoccus mobilis]|uniref:NDP-hexose 3-C-methyltransferase n=1 Tax=Croceicoccus mobilis TaxID=1703339 RepID=A0A917DVZ4_9SPHN|nr:class I SAM-dependent methyltransferase [Croceicoccus mobilis]GGD72122.1 NDP-hexose 3-C-methyltransferase [Croceicoccus mobilis]